MGTQKSNMFDTAYNYLVPEDQEILDKPTHWTPSMQAYNNSASTPIPFLYQHAAGYMPLYMWPNQANSTVLQSNVLQDPMKLSNKPTVSEDAVLAFSEIVHRTFGEQNLNSIKKCARNLQPKSLIPKESRGDGSKSSILKNNKERVLCSEAYGNKGSLHEDLLTANDFPSTKKQHCNLVLENDAIGTNTELVKLEEDEIRRERKRQSNRESARRSRMRKERECEELHKKMEILKDENSMLTQRLKSLSEECLEICNENDAIEVHHLNFIAYLLNYLPFIQM
ncbi:hypothetical protein V8G54_014547 [Vigna mungo]|uniref:BZIP domain-containing protein n=1 Tax=Vigna mungo TaxID=3915 RepID=A0AAQ3NHW9_VIGMU